MVENIVEGLLHIDDSLLVSLEICQKFYLVKNKHKNWKQNGTLRYLRMYSSGWGMELPDGDMVSTHFIYFNFFSGHS